MPIGDPVAGSLSRVVNGATVPSIPAGVTEGELLILLDGVVKVATGSNAVAPVVPTTGGWQQKSSSMFNTTLSRSVRITWMYTRYTDGMSAPSVGLSSGSAASDEHISQIIRVPGAISTGDPTDVIGTASLGVGDIDSMGAYAGYTTTKTDGLTLVGAIRENDLADGTGSAINPLTGDSLSWVEISEYGGASGQNFTWAWNYALVPTARVITSKTFVMSRAGSTSDQAVGQQWAILPEPPDLIVNAPVVDITVEPVTPTVEFFSGTLVPIQDITVQPTLTTVQKVVDVPIVDITVESTATTVQKRVLPPDPVNITVQPTQTDASTGVPIVNIVVEPLPVTVGFSVESSRSDKGRPEPLYVQPVRFIAQSILTKQFLHMDLPINNPEITKTLSGPQMITGEFSNEIRDLQDVGLTPWGTWIHVEENGVIRASGILQPTSTSTSSETLSLEAHGVSAYPMEQPFMGELSLVQADPANIVRLIWQHLQSYSNAKFDVVVRGSTTVRIGKPLPPAPPDPLPDDYVDPNPDDDDDKPYTLVWWEAPDSGTEINNLAQQTPFDYVERENWNHDKTDVEHYIDIGYPRVGRRLDQLGDPTFVEGENLIAGLRIDETPNLYASEVYLYGKGEGRDIIRGYAGTSTPTGSKTDRVRRVVVLEDSTINTKARANAICQDELMRRQALLDVQEIEIDARHENAPIGTFSEGDEVPVKGEAPWGGIINQWERILSYTFNPDTESCAVQLRRAENFRYGTRN